MGSMNKINADFSQRIIVHSHQLDWLDSPMPGVSRRPLDRVGDEVARATSIVRYAPGSQFSSHIHTGGEEFLVLDGVFQDEYGDFPIGSYIRNPPQSKHTPGSKEGCIILVKLWQFEPNDRTHVRLNHHFMKPVQSQATADVAITPLYCDAHEEVSIQDWAPKSRIKIDAKRGLELFVLAGELEEHHDNLTEGSWLRLPIDSHLEAICGANGAKVWLKQNHLPSVDAQVERIESLTQYNAT